MRPYPKLGIIAGNGRFPFLVLDAARAKAMTWWSPQLKKKHFLISNRMVHLRCIGYVSENCPS